MPNVVTIRMRDYWLNNYQFQVYENEGNYRFLLSSNDADVSHHFKISKEQVQEIARDIIKHFQLKLQKAKYVPTEEEIREMFEESYTASGKLRTILRILDDDPLVKEWVKKTLNGEEVP